MNGQFFPLEVALLEKCKKLEKVAKIVDFFEKTDSFVIIMETSTNSCVDLYDYVSEKGRLNEETAKNIFVQIVDVVHALHYEGGFVAEIILLL